MKVLDLFCGAGGLAEGFRQAGARVLAGSDYDPDACATFALNFPEAQVICGDLREARVRKRLLAFDPQLVIGGPPCQAFSQVRNHSRIIDDPRNALYREFVRVVSELEPLGFMMENVPGLAQMGVQQQVEQDLSLGGRYRVKAQLLDAADFGVPQTRKRIVFMGLHSSLGIEAPAVKGSSATWALRLCRMNGVEPIHYKVAGSDLWTSLFVERLSNPNDVTVVTAEQAIGDLEWLQPGTREDEALPELLSPPGSLYQKQMREGLPGALKNISVPRINADTVLRLSNLPAGGNHRDLPDALKKRYLTGELWGPSNGTGQLGRRHYYAYRRLHPGFWSWTLNTKADSVYHYKKCRALSVREFARLQSFPDRFVFTTDSRRGDLPGRIEGGAGHSRYRQVGNAVPPLLAKAVAYALIEAVNPALCLMPNAAAS